MTTETFPTEADRVFYRQMFPSSEAQRAAGRTNAYVASIKDRVATAGPDAALQDIFGRVRRKEFFEAYHTTCALAALLKSGACAVPAAFPDDAVTAAHVLFLLASSLAECGCSVLTAEDKAEIEAETEH